MPFAGRADSLRRAAAAEREARVRAQRAREAREHAAAVAAAVAESGRLVAQRLSAAVAVASRTRDELAAERRQRADGAGQGARARSTSSPPRSPRSPTRCTATRSPRRRRHCASSSSSSTILEQFGMATADLVAEYGPDVPLPPSELEMAEYEQARERGEQVTAPAPMPFDRPTQERRAKKAERELDELGRVNPLALEEFAALEERYNFLSTQLEDVKAARKDLLDVIADVDARILQVFTEAYADVEREFAQVFATLFPGGEGRLLLTDPDDMLTTGIEVEARPPGKKIKRLSLLSGGEKSLTAVAMLVAIFRARPSPFYVMDEVEAALDDVNLRRLISLFEQLRERSQLIVITHQKPTMEVADALYGVTMRDDGITAVISQRMRGQELVASRAELIRQLRTRGRHARRRRSAARSAAPQPCRQIRSSSMNTLQANPPRRQAIRWPAPAAAGPPRPRRRPSRSPWPRPFRCGCRRRRPAARRAAPGAPRRSPARSGYPIRPARGGAPRRSARTARRVTTTCRRPRRRRPRRSGSRPVSAAAAAPMPWPTSLSITGYPSVSTTSRAGPASPRSRCRPRCCIASCSGLVCTARRPRRPGRARRPRARARSPGTAAPARCCRPADVGRDVADGEALRGDLVARA